MLSNRRVTYIEAGSAIQAFLPQASLNLTHIKNNMHAKHHRQDLHDWWNPFRVARTDEIQSAEDYDSIIWVRKNECQFASRHSMNCGDDFP